ncbi:tumor necrosis factor alpha-induced protein 2-like [Hippocampus comes]|uniref:tumor necrosis factor alpha-induced protein 2-like n=1 Tax=Hippocampus comes TaxID=109280 RepID=UPI00094EFA66|nr:PREDICTED: tumor necrosis factor alpha-induced protein 2-like [Hippocampus comes]
MEDNAEGGAGRRPEFPGRLPKNVGPRERAGREERTSARSDDELETTGRMLAAREEELLSGGRPGEERAERLRRDLEVLKLRALTAVRRSFACDDPDDLADQLSGAAAAVRLQEELDRRWAGGGGAPPWRPLKCLASHNALLADVAESRLEEAARDGERDGALRLSTPVKRRVCGMGERVKADLLRCARVLQPCYGPHLDVLNIYAALCVRSLSAQLSGVIRGGLEADDCAYLLFWVNTFYPQEILQHEELRDKLKTACLGALLRRDEVRRLEERYASSQEERVSLWLLRVLRREEEKWSGAGMPEVLDDDYFCPLAVDVIQVIDGSLADLRCVLGDDGAGCHEVAAHLERFLFRYQKALGKLARRKDERASAWMKAHSACEEQLSEYVGSQLVATQRGRRSCARAQGCGDGSRSAPMLRHLANALRLHRPEAVRQEIVAFAGKFPGFSEAALSALLALKSDISAADVSSIKRGVEEELASANRGRAPLAWLKRNKSASPGTEAT